MAAFCGVNPSLLPTLNTSLACLPAHRIRLDGISSSTLRRFSNLTSSCPHSCPACHVLLSHKHLHLLVAQAQILGVALSSSFSHTPHLISPLANPVSSTFRIYLESDHFSSPLRLPLGLSHHLCHLHDFSSLLSRLLTLVLVPLPNNLFFFFFF